MENKEEGIFLQVIEIYTKNLEEKIYLKKRKYKSNSIPKHKKSLYTFFKNVYYSCVINLLN